MKTPRLVLNREDLSTTLAYEGRNKDVSIIADCDTGVQQLVQMLNWENAFRDLLNEQK